MQQVLNYTTKIERIQHALQEQGEINRFIENEDFTKFAEELKDKVTNPEESTTENIVKDKEESSPSPEQHTAERKLKKEEKKEIIEIKEDESIIDFKV
jgi:hypothetical protein